MRHYFFAVFTEPKPRSSQIQSVSVLAVTKVLVRRQTASTAAYTRIRVMVQRQTVVLQITRTLALAVM